MEKRQRNSVNPLKRLADFVKETGKGLQMTLDTDGICIENYNDEMIPIDGWGWGDDDFRVIRAYKDLDQAVDDTITVARVVIAGGKVPEDLAERMP